MNGIGGSDAPEGNGVIKGVTNGVIKGVIPEGENGYQRGASRVRVEGFKELKVEGGEPAPPSPAKLWILAQQLLEAEPIRLPVTGANKTAARAAVECEIRTGKVPEAAFQYILRGARETVAAGGRIDKFWLEDAGWRRPHGKLNPAEAKSQRTREALEARAAKKPPQAAVNE